MIGEPTPVIVARNFGLLFLSFAVSGLLNVGAQAFFARVTPDEKQLWLTVTLLVGTFASIAGVAAAARVGFPGRPAWTGAGMVAAVGVLVWAGFYVASVPAYVVLHVLTRGAANFASQEIDRRAVRLAGAEHRRQNDRIGTALRFVGMWLGPLWFGLFPDAGAPMGLALAALTAASVVATSGLASVPPPDGAPETPTGPIVGPERVLVASAVIISAGYVLLGSNIVYVLSDLHHQPDATAFGGLLVTIAYGGAIVTAVAAAPLTRRGLGPAWMLPAPALLVFAGLYISSPLAKEREVAVPAAALLGVGFALFQLAFREYVTREAARGRGGILGVFNNLGNTSALLGFGVMLALVGGGPLLGIWYQEALPAGVAALGGAGLLGGGLALGSAARDRRRPGGVGA